MNAIVSWSANSIWRRRVSRVLPIRSFGYFMPLTIRFISTSKNYWGYWALKWNFMPRRSSGSKFRRRAANPTTRWIESDRLSSRSINFSLYSNRIIREWIFWVNKLVLLESPFCSKLIFVCSFKNGNFDSKPPYRSCNRLTVWICSVGMSDEKRERNRCSAERRSIADISHLSSSVCELISYFCQRKRLLTITSFSKMAIIISRLSTPLAPANGHPFTTSFLSEGNLFNSSIEDH